MNSQKTLPEVGGRPYHSEHPLIFTLILTILYGLIYLPDYLNLDKAIFQNLTPFGSIFFEFITRFVLSGLLWIVFVPYYIYLRNGFSIYRIGQSIRLHSSYISKKVFIFGIFLSLSFFLIVMGFAVILGVFTPDFYLLYSPEYENGLGWFIFIFALIPGIWEEIAFRGFIFSFLQTEYSARKAMIYNGALFSLFHTFNYFLLGQELTSVVLTSIAAFPVGFALAYLVFKTESLLPAIMIHYTIDVTLFISGFIFTLTESDSSIIFTLLALVVLPPLMILFFTQRFGNKSTK